MWPQTTPSRPPRRRASAASVRSYSPMKAIAFLTFSLAQQLLHDVVVKLRPIPSGPELPAVDDVAHQIDGLGFVMAQEVEKLLGLAAARSQMDIRQKQCSNPPRASRHSFKHPLSCAWRAYQ